MTENEFYERLQDHLRLGPPFVAYRMPGEKKVKAFLQRSQETYRTLEFTEPGFVFAPFNDEHPAFIIPEDQADILSCTISEFQLNQGGSKRRKTSEPELPEAKKRHLDLVRRGLEALQSGQLEKVVLSRREEIYLPQLDPIRCYRDLVQKYPTAFVYLWFHPETGYWLAATPETLLDISGNQVSTMALAGTQAYQGSSDVVWGEKEREEQQFVTSEILENLAPYTSGIRVSPVKTVKAGKLLHLRSDIKARMSHPERNLKNLLKALHPTPAVCGLPKQKAKDFILSEEGYDREFYTGFVGELNLQKNVQRSRNKRNVENLAYRSVKQETSLFVNLRCMKLEGDKAILFIGGGITKDSVPEDEWEETVDKAETMKGVLGS